MPTPKISFLAIAAVLILGCSFMWSVPALGQENREDEATADASATAGEVTPLPEILQDESPATAQPAASQAAPHTVPAYESTSPPKNLKKVGDHWTPYDPPDPESIPPDATLHIIVRGDTLWDLADLAYGDPYLWPQIWNENRYILDSHWIYPGDPLLLPPRPVVVTAVGRSTVPTQVVPQGQQGAPPTSDEPPPVEPEPVPETLTAQMPAPPPPPPPAAAAAAAPATAPATYGEAGKLSESDLLCSGYISQRRRKRDILFIGSQRDPEVVGLTEGDVVYLNRGRENGGIREGQEFEIVVREGKILHPRSNRTLGHYYKRLGLVKVLASLARTSIATISLACDEIRAGYELLPYEPSTFPDLTPPRFDDLAVGEYAKPTGYVVHTKDNIVHVATGDIVYIDLGSEDGLAPGVFLTAFEENRRPLRSGRKHQRISYRWGGEQVESPNLHEDDKSDYPPKIVAQLVVLKAQSYTATAKIIHSVAEVAVGTMVEVE